MEAHARRSCVELKNLMHFIEVQDFQKASFHVSKLYGEGRTKGTAEHLSRNYLPAPVCEHFGVLCAGLQLGLAERGTAKGEGPLSPVGQRGVDGDAIRD